MPLKYKLGAVAIFGLAVGLYVLVDALVISDEELIEKFIKDVTGSIEPGYVDRTTSYVNFERLPLDVRVLMHEISFAGVYDASAADELKHIFSKNIGRFYGDELRVLGRTIDIKSDRADVEMTLLSARGMGRLIVALKMRKLDQKWWVEAVEIHR